MKHKSTKSALLMSFTSLLLCFAMLIGSTFAWFTDSVTSGVNKIVAGNLDVEVEYSKDGSTWADLQNSASLFTSALWEPGHTEYVVLRIHNEGSLALKYQVLASIVNEIGSINVEGQQFKLSNYLKYGVQTTATAPADMTRDQAKAIATSPLNNYTSEARALAAKGTTTVYDYVLLAITMPESVGNEANYDRKYNAPQIDLGITVVATQNTTVEADSFGNDYDAAATYPASDFVPTTDVIYPVVVSVTASTTGENVISKTVESVQVAKATVSATNAGDVLAMHVIPTPSTTVGYTLTADQADKTYDIEVTVNGKKQENVPMEIFIGKGLSNVMLYHAGDTNPLQGTIYNAETGMLSFTAPSFSEYHVVYDAPKYVAMVGGKYYATLRDAATAMNGTNYNFALIDEAAWEAATPVYWQTANKSGFAATMTTATTAAYNAADGAITMVCRPGADLGEMTHGHVANNLTVFGNHAKISGGEHDFELDTYTGVAGPAGSALTGDVTLAVYALDGAAAWGQRYSDYTINLKFVDCQNMNRIYFSSAKGTINIDVQNCSFDGANGSSKNASIKTDSQGTWNIKNTSFKDIAVAVALTNENGPATLNINNCSFTDIATKANAAEQNADGYASPIRVLGRSAASVNVDNCRFTYSVNSEKNFEDIVIGEVRADKAASEVVEYTVKNTYGTLLSVEPHEKNATISKKTITLNGEEISGSNAKVVPVTTTEELINAIGEAKEGDVILVSSPLNEIVIPSFSKRLTLKGEGNTRAVFANDAYGNSAASLPTGAVFEGFTVECGNSLYHGFQHSGQITFKNCSFTGFLTTYADMTFENCTFTSTLDKYSINFYGGSNFVLNNCHFFGADKNVYIYQESLDGDKNVTFNKCDFHMSGNKQNPTDTKSAIMLNAPVSYNDHKYDVTINECTYEGDMNKTAAENVAGNTNYQGLYGLKHKNGSGNPQLIVGTVTVNGTVVYSNPAN